MTPDERLAAYEAGADTTPHPEGTVPTPGQLWARLLSLPAERRLAILAHSIGVADVATACFVENHRGRIEELREYCERLEALTPGLRGGRS